VTTLGKRLRQRRKALGLTQAQVAAPRYTKAYVSALETGHIRCSLRALEHLAERLYTTPAALLSDDIGLPAPEAIDVAGLAYALAAGWERIDIRLGCTPLEAAARIAERYPRTRA
jgi:transcriptional regulator with XRE-family HTH domain